MTWNEYMYAKVIGSTRFQTLPVYVLTLANQQFRSDAGILSAAALVTMAPVIGLVIGFQRLIVAGLTEGALKE
jgi:ABC-type glycerol-3-phosphate transport system permease component